jgi:hypothetical protein
MQNEMQKKLVELLYEARKEWDFYFNNGLLKGETRSKTLQEFIADHLIKNGVIAPPCKVGEEIWVVEEDDTTCYMFLAKSKGCIIATSWINDYDLDETIEYHIEETQNNLDTGLAVFPEDICFVTREEAEEKLKGGLIDA